MVLLVTPNTKQINYGLTSHEFSAIQPNIYMELLASVYTNLRKIECRTIHMEADRVDIPSLLKYIRYMRPSEVGIIVSGSNPSASTMSMPGAVVVCHAIKDAFPSLHVFVWGGHPSALPERTLLETGADRVVQGTDFGVHPRHIPMVNWQRIDPTKYKAHNWHCFGDLDTRSPYAVIWTSLGCPYRCEFCCINNLFLKRTYLMRDMSDVIAEVDLLVRKFHVKHLKIMDELFVSSNHSRVEEFCNTIISRRYNLNMWCFARTDTVNPRILSLLKRAGVNWIAYGFETLNPEALVNQKKGAKINEYEKVIKWTKDAGISIIADFIAGFWEDDFSTLEATYEFACTHNFEFINLYPLFAYPGTPLFTRYLSSGIIREPQDWNEYSLYGWDCRPCPTKSLSASEVLSWRDEKYVAYYQRPEYLEMIERRFGLATRDHVSRMATKKLERKICQVPA